ncbi:hypothetical protein EJ08DRAFT_701406 [Tothia fuscella]|uniref:Uncharacterized protein n=1 Tax=Tothia fuscella TaxID=1048955 RepID=A0A9P4NIG7_9PEZI|nr:hypothetical protein EJ08DRAFT_701406 [Tothia fuscella]
MANLTLDESTFPLLPGPIVAHAKPNDVLGTNAILRPPTALINSRLGSAAVKQVPNAPGQKQASTAPMHATAIPVNATAALPTATVNTPVSAVHTPTALANLTHAHSHGGRPRANVVQIYLETGGKNELLWPDFPLQNLVTASRYAASRVVHLPGTTVLDLSSSATTKCNAIEVLKYILDTNPKYMGVSTVTVDANQNCDYYFELLRTPRLFNLNSRLNYQQGLRIAIIACINGMQTITKEQMGRLWEFMGKDKEVMDMSTKKLVVQLGLELDPTSKGVELVSAEKNVLDDYIDFFGTLPGYGDASLTKKVNHWYMVAEKRYLSKQREQERKAEVSRRAEEKAAVGQKEVKGKPKAELLQQVRNVMNSNSVNTCSFEVWEGLPRPRR